MTPPRESQDRSHSQLQELFCLCREHDISAASRHRILATRAILPQRCTFVFRSGTANKNSSMFSVRGINPRRSSLLRGVVGAFSCVHYRGRRSRLPSNPNARSSMVPNNRSCRSDQSFHQSPEHFGRARQLSTLRLRAIVRCAPLKCISPATAIGPAMRSPPLLPKSYDDTPCAMCA